MTLEQRIIALAQAIGADIKALASSISSNAQQLLGKTWAAPAAIGSTTPNTGLFTTLASTESLGYGSGAGGTVTQAVSKATSVTLNKPSGLITMHNSALAAGASVGFALFNSVIQANDSVIAASLWNGSYNGTNYSVEVRQVGAGGVYVYVTNKSAGSLSDSLQIQYNVIRGKAS